MSSQPRDIIDVAESIGIPESALTLYGRYAAKVEPALVPERIGPPGKLVLVTSMSPTPAGEGKTTLSIGLAQSLKRLGARVSTCLRQPSLGPLMGSKGGGVGSARSSLHPRELISMMFTGDDAAVTTAHNLISALTENRIHHDTPPVPDTGRILWPRASAIGDRALRRVRLGVGADGSGGYAGRFIISAASELASILCMSADLSDMTSRIARVLVAYTQDGKPITAGGINAAGAAAAVMRDAIRPNLVQSTEGSPVFVHGGPFGNISIGTSSIASARLALRTSDVVLIEAGFATDLGGEKFYDILCRAGGFWPSAAVVVATLAALRLHGGATDYTRPDTGAAIRGIANLARHVENIRGFGTPAVVALNRFAGDDAAECDAVRAGLAAIGIDTHIVDVRDQGGRGGEEAAAAILEFAGAGPSPTGPAFAYQLDSSIEDKITTIAERIYGASGVEFTDKARSGISEIERLGLGSLPVCMAKTHTSLSDDPALLGAPTGFTVHVRDVYAASGAGFVVAMCGPVLLMPGLPAHPRAEDIGVDTDGNITGI